jgi:hypothetical protein
MASLKDTLAVTPGSGASLIVEGDAGGDAPVNFTYPGRLIPVAPADAAHSAFSVDNATTVDLLGKAPAGATFARFMLADTGGDLSWWDNGLDPDTDGEGMVVKAGDWYDVQNLPELAAFKMLATSATAALVRVSWYKTS